MKLLVIADDFTGALDTGVQFKAKNTRIRICEGAAEKVFENLPADTQVLIVDAQTRHLPPETAYRRVYEIVRMAKALGVGCIYKKTDSALRGNIGSELTAALDAAGETTLHFVPAFPVMRRVTQGGIHYIDGVPVAQSVFGADAFEPVTNSDVAQIIAQQSPVCVQNVPVGQKERESEDKKIAVYDAQSDAELFQIASQLKTSGKLNLLAGCAGFAGMLPALLDLEQQEEGLPALAPRLLTLCGSINPITVRQLDRAEACGMARVCLTARQKLTSEWMDAPDGQALLAGWNETLKKTGSFLIDCGPVFDEAELARCERDYHVRREDLREQISGMMGKILRQMLKFGTPATVLVTGGDTLHAFLQEVGVTELCETRELVPGVVLTKIPYAGRDIALISKSGGFGEPELICKLLDMIKQTALLGETE